ncbi:MAG: RDD family protein [Blastochloris sp.]|nr:RDD family protein [Blastochloris sp.]
MPFVSAEEHYRIDTPENIEFSYTIAGIGSRFLAAIIDTLLLLLLLLSLAVAMLTAIGMLEGTGSTTATTTLTVIWGLLSFTISWGYYIFFELIWNGQSPGKRSVRLRVVREGGRPITFAASAIRNLVRFIDFLPGFYGLGVLVMFIDLRARRLGDLSGGTMVVKEQHAVSLEHLVARAEQLSPLAPPQEGASLADVLPNIQLLSDTDYNLVQEFLRRRGELGRESRTRLGTQLANGIRARIGSVAENDDHELFLERIAHDYRLLRQQETRHLAKRSGLEAPGSSLLFTPTARAPGSAAASASCLAAAQRRAYRI